MKKAKNERHKDNNIEPSSSCLRGVRIGGGEEDNNSHQLLSFTRAMKEEKKTQR
jgi:hypothetical protein